MENRFYQAFDAETYAERRTSGGRTAFQVDRDRVIYFPAFRRLQSKTQVFLPGEYDFYRTRLTHSIEVAQIGRGLCQHLRASSPLLAEDFFIDSDLVEAVCLTHDLGHPPFGHIGERVLNDLLRPHGGFEGNAQTVRLITEKAYEREDADRGMAPTRALLDGVLKYKRLRREWPEPPENHFLYDEQRPVREFTLGTATARLPRPLRRGDALNRFRSIECQVMDWADDTAYSLNDIVDGVSAGFITFERLERWASARTLDAASQEWLQAVFDAIRSDRLERLFSSKIGTFIAAASLAPRAAGSFLADRTHRHAFDLVVEPAAGAESRFYKSIALELIFKSPQIQQVEFKGRHILIQLWRALEENYLGRPLRRIQIAPARIEQRLARAGSRREQVRVLADYLATMTDGMALRSYKRLFDPDFRSFTELMAM